VYHVIGLALKWVWKNGREMLQKFIIENQFQLGIRNQKAFPGGGGHYVKEIDYDV
jgi:hypothetical protein